MTFLVVLLTAIQEHHLQAVISASAAASLGGKVAQIYIPTPETKSSVVPYDQLYPKTWSEPHSYIRFSSTVEDCIGPPYCLTDEDDKFLQNLNQGKSQANGNDKDGQGKCSEDIFEEVMSFFEETAKTRQPFAAVDNPPVLSFDELEQSYDDTISPEARRWAGDIYPHWQSLRLERGNLSLLPDLKFETGQETDDADAYVCFRRREVRQARKTRGRDAQVVEKLKKLRRELEDARQLVHCINQRERLNSERAEQERKVFEQRSELKRVKIAQGIKGDKGDDEELLINQRVRLQKQQMRDHILTCRSQYPNPSPRQTLPSNVRRLYVLAQAVQKVALLRMISSSCPRFRKKPPP